MPTKKTTSPELATDGSILLEYLIDLALKAGATSADAVLVSGMSESLSFRLGELEDVERSEGRDLGLRAFVGNRQAIVSTTDIRKPLLTALAERAVDMARNTPEDSYAGLADPNLLAHQPWPDNDIFDATELNTDILQENAQKAEDAARSVAGVTNSEGASASWSHSAIHLATSSGFAGDYKSSSHGTSVSVLAGNGTSMERDYDYSSARHYSDLEDPAIIGQRAGERTVRRLNARKVKTCQAPVLFDPRVSSSLLGHFSGAINGHSIARGTSFLKSSLGKKVFGKGIRIIDDPHLKRGLRSKPFDGEGVKNGKLDVIEDGVLTTWLLDSASARQLGLQSNGRASRGTSGPPGAGTTNLYMAPGDMTREDMIADIKQGFYVTELIGMGVNGITGDYSRGASGFWIENGEIAFPVSEMTIAGNLIDMFAALVPANDLEFRYGTNAPTVRIDGMTIAGN